MRRTALIVFAVIALLAPVGCARSKANKQAFCRELRRAPSLEEIYAGLASDDPATLRQKARQTTQQFRQLLRSAPREIRSKVSEVARLVDRIAKAIEQSPDDLASVAANLRGNLISNLGAGRAGLELASYSLEKCHYDLNSRNGTIPTTSIPGPPTPPIPTTGSTPGPTGAPGLPSVPGPTVTAPSTVPPSPPSTPTTTP